MDKLSRKRSGISRHQNKVEGQRGTGRKKLQHLELFEDRGRLQKLVKEDMMTVNL